MLRLLSIRNFVVVDALELELAGGFTVLTGETGAGKSILLDALALLLGDRFEVRQLKPGADRAELAAEFDLRDAPAAASWTRVSPKAIPRSCDGRSIAREEAAPGSTADPRRSRSSRLWVDSSSTS